MLFFCGKLRRQNHSAFLNNKLCQQHDENSLKPAWCEDRNPYSRKLSIKIVNQIKEIKIYRIHPIPTEARMHWTMLGKFKFVSK